MVFLIAQKNNLLGMREDSGEFPIIGKQGPRYHKIRLRWIYPNDSAQSSVFSLL